MSSQTRLDPADALLSQISLITLSSTAVPPCGASKSSLLDSGYTQVSGRQALTMSAKRPKAVSSTVLPFCVMVTGARRSV
eukprot:6196049-Pleurochrysis_carterae.AAC.3